MVSDSQKFIGKLFPKPYTSVFAESNYPIDTSRLPNPLKIENNSAIIQLPWN
jgi:hypothetical protein